MGRNDGAHLIMDKCFQLGRVVTNVQRYLDCLQIVVSVFEMVDLPDIGSSGFQKSGWAWVEDWGWGSGGSNCTIMPRFKTELCNLTNIF